MFLAFAKMFLFSLLDKRYVTLCHICHTITSIAYL